MSKQYSFLSTLDEYLSYCEERTSCVATLDSRNCFYEKLREKCQGDLNLLDEDDREILYENAEAIIRRSTSSKPQRAEFYNDFIEFVVDRKLSGRDSITLKKITKAFSDTERRLDLIKNYRVDAKKETNQVLADRYHVSPQTISSDYIAIESGEFQVFDQKFAIDARTVTDDVKSTVVPLVLAQNITQVIAMLSGLGEMSKVTGFESYAKKTACAVWGQLTEHVREILKKRVLELELDKEWYDEVAEYAEYKGRIFFPERDFEDLSSKLLMYYKVSRRFDLYYDDHGEKKKYTKAMVRNWEYTKALIEYDDGKEAEIEIDKIAALEKLSSWA